jgi:hypothetical protein
MMVVRRGNFLAKNWGFRQPDKGPGGIGVQKQGADRWYRFDNPCRRYVAPGLRLCRRHAFRVVQPRFKLDVDTVIARMAVERLTRAVVAHLLRKEAAQPRNCSILPQVTRTVHGLIRYRRGRRHWFPGAESLRLLYSLFHRPIRRRNRMEFGRIKDRQPTAHLCPFCKKQANLRAPQN